MRATFRKELAGRLATRSVPDGLAEPTPGTTVEQRLEHAAHAALLDACDGFLRRAALAASLTADERREILRGMLLTRATDNRLKQFFTGGEVRYGDTPFQGKGFRSLGQEAIYAAGIRLRRGAASAAPTATWHGDVDRAGHPRSRRHARHAARRRRRCGMVLSTPRWARRRRRWTARTCTSATSAGASCPPAAPLAIGDADRRRHGDGLLARGRRPRGALVHRRGRQLARRVARGDQSLRGAAAAGGVLRPEQPDGALDAGAPSSRPSACSPTRPSATGSRASPSTAPIRTRSPRRSPGPPSARAPAAAPRSSSWSPCVCAATRTTTTCCTSGSDPQASWDYPPLTEAGYADPRAVRVLGRARSDSGLRRAARAERRRRGRRPRPLQARGRGGRRGARRAR